MAKRTTRRGRTSRKNKSRKKRIVRKRMKGGAPDDLDSKSKKYWPKDVRDDSIKRAKEHAKEHAKWRSEYTKKLRDMKLNWKKEPRALTNSQKYDELVNECSKMSIGISERQKSHMYNSKAYDDLLSMCGKMSISADEGREATRRPAVQPLRAVADEGREAAGRDVAQSV